MWWSDSPAIPAMAMQLTGNHFTEATAIYGNDLAHVSRLSCGNTGRPPVLHLAFRRFRFISDQKTSLPAGDDVDVLVAMNPAALIPNLADLLNGGLVIVDRDAFSDKNLIKAGYKSNPIEDGSLDAYRLIAIDVTKNVLEAVKPFGLSHKFAVRCKNMWTLGLMMWLFDRARDNTIEGLRAKFHKAPEIAEANIAALNAGHAYGEIAELPSGVEVYKVPPADVKPGLYRNTTGTEALSYGLLAAGQLAGLPILFASYPITPASSLLHTLSAQKQFDVVTFQAEG